MKHYYQPIVRSDDARPDSALPLAGGELWFSQVIRKDRSGGHKVMEVDALTSRWRQKLSAPRKGVAGMDMARPNIMGILNVTPDSFSDGGRNAEADTALNNALKMIQDGADIIDIGGESTRPGADFIPEDIEIERTAPVIKALRTQSDVAISIDTRKAAVAAAAHQAGASLVNDVAGFTFDDALAPYCADNALPVCIMHAQGDPATMQENPSYDDVLLDVYDFLENQITKLESLGLPRDMITVDPGIGFGKTISHNLNLLKNISLFHGLGCPILLGASRKGFIGRIGGATVASERLPGSLAVALHAASQGVHILRVHDVAETAQGVALWQAVVQGTYHGT